MQGTIEARKGPPFLSAAGSAEERLILCEALNRLLNKGVVLVGDVTISLANVDLIWIGLELIVTSVETARRSLLEIDCKDVLHQDVYETSEKVQYKARGSNHCTPP